MGPGVPRALLYSLLLLGVFTAFATPTVFADERVSTSTEPTQEIASSTPDTPPDITSFSALTESESELPTGVLFDNSYADTEWDVNGYGSGHIIYRFPDTGSWTTPNTIVYARIQKPIDAPCSLFYVAGVYGMLVYSTSSPLPSFYNDHVVESGGGMYCDFYFSAGGIPANTTIQGFVLSGASVSIPGSSHNPGTSLNGGGENPVPGSFAFQLCGTGGCSGGFASSTPPTPPGPKISNVLFLPGIEQSRLYRTKAGCDDDSPSCEQSLWNPVNGDTWPDELSLTADGKSSNPNIFTKERDTVSEIDLGPIQGARKFYTSFFNDLDTLVGHEFWREVTYDWRLSLDDLLTHGVQHGSRIYYSEATSTPYIEQTLRELASKSPTGKVTIIAHSNGGLVAKALLKKLGDTESARLVDRLILVAVPQSGSPQAIGGLLYGYGSALPFDKCANLCFTSFFCGMYVSRAEVRNMALNSPMTYHLLPSQAYFDSVQDPNHSVFSFEGMHMFGAEINAYGRTIDSWDELSRFLAAKEAGRGQAGEDVNVPAIGNSSLLEYARDTHQELDTWVPPEDIGVYQIAGWGDRTVSGISWYEELQSSNPTPIYKKQYRPIFVEDGDNVVPAPSALQIPASSHVTNLWVNFQKEASNHFRFPKLGHGEILETSELRTTIKKIITQSETLNNEVVSSARPIAPSRQKRLVFIIHSPLKLKISNSTEQITGDALEDFDQSTSIPNSDFGYFGEVRYVVVPADDVYTLTLYGQSAGTFSLDTYIEEDNNSGPITTIAAIPVTSGTKGTITVDGRTANISPLEVDSNGDGSSDLVIRSTFGQSTTYEPTSEHHTHSASIPMDRIFFSTKQNATGTIPTMKVLENNLKIFGGGILTTSSTETRKAEESAVQIPEHEANTQLTTSAYNAVNFQKLNLFFRDLLEYLRVAFSQLLKFINL